MRCPQCQHQNNDVAKFCEECGAKLITACPQCGQQVSPTAKFCAECGTAVSGKAKGKSHRAKSKSSSPPPQHPAPNPQHPISYTPRHLAERILAEREAMEARGALDGERKTITALFADLKGSTALIEDLDPEEARRIIDPALHLMMNAVHRYEGYVAQSLGDGIFALFGAPIAHEDHVHRALYAALLMQDDMRRYGETLRAKGSPPLLMRVGVNTGEVVVRSIRKDDLQTDYVPIGHSTNIAARLENLAVPGSIVVSPSTHRLTEGYFEFKPLGETQIKGVSAPLQLHEVLGVGPLRTKMQVAARRGLARFVGRQSEMEQLRKALDSAKAGHGQIAGVMGEPGVGKSRLFYEFKLLAQRGCLLLETFSVSHGKAYPYLPLIDLLKNYFQLGLQDDERQRREKITGKVLTLDRGLEDTLPYFFFLLGLAESTSPLQQMDAQMRRRRILDAIKRLLIRESLNQPLIVIFEDLHWLDAETQAFLQLLSESIPTARLLLLVNYRPEYQHIWSGKTFFSQLRLDPLGREQAEEMLTVLLGDVGAQHAAPLRQFILDKTEGNPFFMEEIVQALREQGMLDVGARHAVPLPNDLRLPATVQGVLTSRIDRLPPEEKALLQTLAVIGKEFSLSLLMHVVADQSEDHLPEDYLLRRLARLQTNEFIYERPAFPDIEYTFKHALTQEVAYNSLLVERRKTVHERAARTIEDLYRAKLDDRYSELAHHYSRSGNTQKAVAYLQLAGQQAAQRSAYAEAVNHFTAALALLKILPDSENRDRQELTLQTALGISLIPIRGYTVPEVGQTYTRARELCEQLGETTQLFFVLRGLWLFSTLGAEYETARKLAHQGLSLAQRLQDPLLLLGAHQDLGFFSLWPAEWAAAREHFERVAALHDPHQHSTYVSLYEADLGVWALSEAALALWFLGYPDQARQKLHEALTLAHKLAHPNTLGWALGCSAWLHQYLREPQKTQERAEAEIALALEHGFLPWLVYGTVSEGWALAMQGREEEGIASIQKGMTLAQSMGSNMAHSYHLALLAKVYGNKGQHEEGLKILAEALEFVEKRGERFYEAEIYRLKGELTLQQEGSRLQALGLREKIEEEGVRLQAVGLREKAEEAKKCFHKAIEIAQKQQAKSLELRATMSLARLWQAQGKHREAHTTLSEVYNWFTEGFDTKDLQEAKALLDTENENAVPTVSY
ncbi:MAG: AAA family ATPase [Deltaproteobacteria bacterium]|nr:AAA family ATPase [Deltaproteobacteria bacterium]